MRNLLIDQLEPGVELVSGQGAGLEGMMQGIDSTDVVAFIGYHTGAGRQGILSHTYIGQTINDVRLNGEHCNEGRMNALLAAEFSVPVVLVTGDDLTCDESSTWAPNAQRVAVKVCIDRYTAQCLPPARTFAMIRDAAQHSLGDMASVERPEGPFTYDVSFDAAHCVVACMAIPGVARTGDTSVSFSQPTMFEAIRCFKAVTVLAYASIEPDYG